MLADWGRAAGSGQERTGREPGRIGIYDAAERADEIRGRRPVKEGG